MKTPAKYVTGTTVLPFNPAAFGEVGLVYTFILLFTKVLKNNVIPKEVSVKFFCVVDKVILWCHCSSPGCLLEKQCLVIGILNHSEVYIYLSEMLCTDYCWDFTAN